MKMEILLEPTSNKLLDNLKMEMEMEIPSVKASANSDIMYFFTSAQDGDPLQDDVRLCLGDDLKKAQDHNQRQVKDESKDHYPKALCYWYVLGDPQELFLGRSTYVFEVDLVTGQLRRARERYGRPLNSDKEVRPVEETINVNNQEVEIKVETLLKEDVSEGDNQNEMGYQMESLKSLLKITEVDSGDNSMKNNTDESKKLNVLMIPVDFLCPISLELMRDPIIVSTGCVDKGLVKT
ncbi:U-box domain-containing protein 11-like protein [Tanacetum coccineum]